jgi:hypothetical protein
VFYIDFTLSVSNFKYPFDLLPKYRSRLTDTLGGPLLVVKWGWAFLTLDIWKGC